MKNVYLAIWYGCNQRCFGCPVSRNENRSQSLTVEDIRGRLEDQLRDEPFSVTISGGEPTLHPQFLEIMDLFKAARIPVCILTNAERFGERAFCDAFLRHIELSHTSIVTTIHASDPAIHEGQNGSVGSFAKSISGLQYLSFRGVQVTIKHCITAKNYADTADFIRCIDESFHPSVAIQLWGLDYSGLPKENAQELYIPFAEMRPKLEEALDAYLEIRERNYRQLSMHNLPLCAVDPFYWGLMPDRKDLDFRYAAYYDPTTETFEIQSDAGKQSAHCTHCDVQEYCGGAYLSLFEYFGDDAVTPIQAEILE